MARIGAKLGQNSFQTIPDISFFDAPNKFPAKNLDHQIRFSLFLRGFGAARGKRTSKSASASNFAPDAPILRSVRPEIMKKGSCNDVDVQWGVTLKIDKKCPFLSFLFDTEILDMFRLSSSSINLLVEEG